MPPRADIVTDGRFFSGHRPLAARLANARQNKVVLDNVEHSGRLVAGRGGEQPQIPYPFKASAGRVSEALAIDSGHTRLVI